MKKVIFLLAVLTLIACDQREGNAIQDPNMDLEYYDFMEFDGLERTFYIHLPQNYDNSISYPLIFAMHGGGILGYEGIEAQSLLSELSDVENFIVVYPEGVEQSGFRTWNAGDCCPNASLLETDDVGFINALLDKLKLELSINERKVYATGFSNGGQLAYKLANRYSHKIAAVASVAGVLQDFPFDPIRKVPIIHFHSYRDTTAPFTGGFSDAPLINFEFPSVDATHSWILNNYGCNRMKQTVFSDPNRYDFFRYSDCENNAQIELYVSHDGGHSWPGGQALLNTPITNHFNASSLMWEFFQNYELP